MSDDDLPWEEDEDDEDDTEDGECIVCGAAPDEECDPRCPEWDDEWDDLGRL
jgi:hypothetical protein